MERLCGSLQRELRELREAEMKNQGEMARETQKWWRGGVLYGMTHAGEWTMGLSPLTLYEGVNGLSQRFFQLEADLHPFLNKVCDDLDGMTRHIGRLEDVAEQSLSAVRVLKSEVDILQSERVERATRAASQARERAEQLARDIASDSVGEVASAGGASEVLGAEMVGSRRESDVGVGDPIQRLTSLLVDGSAHAGGLIGELQRGLGDLEARCRDTLEEHVLMIDHMHGRLQRCEDALDGGCVYHTRRPK